MKKIVTIIICMFLSIVSVNAIVRNNYATSVNKTNSYITKFKDYKIFIDQEETLPYIYNKKGLSKSDTFKKSGFISVYELMATLDKNNRTYLFNGSKYWTNTEENDKIHIINVRTDNVSELVSKLNEQEMKPTQYILPQTLIVGSGTHEDPWTFVKPEFKITVKAYNGKVNGSVKIEETINDFESEYTIAADDHYELKSDNDITCNNKATIINNNGKLQLKNIRSDLTCEIRYTKKVYNITVKVNNGTVNGKESEIYNIDALTDKSIQIEPLPGYGLVKSDCSSIYVYDNDILTFKEIKGNITCELFFDITKKEYKFTGKEEEYPVPADGTYTISVYGAQGGGENGGKGGFVKTEIKLNKGKKLKINVGGQNGYNGGGGFNNTTYTPGGGASTVEYNGTKIIIAAGGGAMAPDKTAGGAGGSGTGAGGANAGSGAGLAGTNGGGGTNSIDYNYKCNCQTCGGQCTEYYPTYDCNCSTCGGNCTSYYPTYDCRCSTCGGGCKSYASTYKCNCSTCGGQCTAYYSTYSCNCKTCKGSCKSYRCTKYSYQGNANCYCGGLSANCCGCTCSSYSTYSCNCQTCGGGCKSYAATYDCNCSTCGGGCTSYYPEYECNCSTCGGGCKSYSAEYECNCKTCGGGCKTYAATYECNCKRCTTNGKPGQGGKNSTSGTQTVLSNVSGNRSGNGYILIEFKEAS